MVRRASAIFTACAVLAFSTLLIVTLVDHRANQLREAQASEQQPKAERIPPLDFSKYPSESSPPEALQARLDFNGPAMEPFRRYRTLLQNAVLDGRANMAGHYKLIDIPCGSGCHYWWLVDLRSGQIHKTPSEEPVRFAEAITQMHSRLVLFKGRDLPEGNRCLFAYYEWLEEELKFRGVKQGEMGVDC